MGGLFSPSVPTPPPPPPVPPAAIPPTMASSAVQAAGASQLAKAAKQGAYGGTVSGSEQGDLAKPATTSAGLLGG